MATYLNYPFDPELFNYNWANAVDPTKTAIYESGAVVEDAAIANLISTGSDFYTLPFYGVIGGTPDNYDGATNILTDAPQGASQSGVVFGRAHGWTEKQFVRDYNSGADPMGQIVSQVAKYWNKYRQSLMVKMVDACIAAGSTNFANHVTDIASTSTTVAAANKLGATSIGDAAVKACGDNAGIFSMAVMHSQVANGLAGLQLLEYAKYTDARGIERPLPIAYINGMLVIIDDGVTTVAATGSAAKKYSTYLFGAGAVRHASAPVTLPSEVARDAFTNGGQNTLITRIRETIHVDGFSFTKPSSGYTASPTDAQLTATANWSMVGNEKNIAIAKIVSNA